MIDLSFMRLMLGGWRLSVCGVERFPAGDKLLPSEMRRSRISQAKMVGFSRLYCSILETTAGVATFGLDPPIRPGGRRVPVGEKTSDDQNQNCEVICIQLRGGVLSVKPNLDAEAV